MGMSRWCSTWATRWDSQGRQVFLNVLNRSEKNDISANVENLSGGPAAVDVWELNHPNLKATHTFGADKVVRPAMKSANVKSERNGFAYLFPKHSLTILKTKTR
jgi:alpha-L-arabinofuranosidase